MNHSGIPPTRHVHTPAFTLVELLVVLVILSVLGSLSLAGLNVGRQRAKRDKTMSTIRKLNEIVQEMYTDRLTTSGTAASAARLLTYEMPDQWADVQTAAAVASLSKDARSAAVIRYGRIAADTSKRAALDAKLGPAECLWLIVARSGYAPDSLEHFRPDELTDRDGDGAKEFCDGWGQPIYFLRWAPGFAPYSAVEVADEISAASNVVEQLNALTPLIYSAGPDGATTDVLATEEAYGLQRPTAARTLFSPRDEFPLSGAPQSGSTAYRDNITNHNIMAR